MRWKGQKLIHTIAIENTLQFLKRDLQQLAAIALGTHMQMMFSFEQTTVQSDVV